MHADTEGINIWKYIVPVSLSNAVHETWKISVYKHLCHFPFIVLYHIFLAINDTYSTKSYIDIIKVYFYCVNASWWFHQRFYSSFYFSPARLATLITRPSPPRRSGKNALVTLTTPMTLTSIICWNCVTEHHSISWNVAMPALFTRAHKTVQIKKDSF